MTYYKEDLKRAMGEMFAEVDEFSLTLTKERAVLLENLCNKILEEKDRLETVDKNIMQMFGPDIDTTGAKSKMENLETFFTSINSGTSSIVLRAVREYLMIERQFSVFVKKVLSETKGPSTQYNSPALAKAMDKTDQLLLLSNDLYVKIKLNLPKLEEKIYESIEMLNKYLKNRFIKKVEEEKEQRVLIIRPDKNEPLAKYVKIKLVDDNPLLTDVLLSVIEELPRYTEQITKTSRKKKTVKTLSGYDVDRVAERLIVLSDHQMSSYIQDPKKFFSNIGNALEDFYSAITKFDNAHINIFNTPELTVNIHPEDLEALKTDDKKRNTNLIKKIKSASLENIVQSEDDYLPDNRKEKDHFKLRDKLITLLHGTIKNFSSVKEYDEKLQVARKAVEEAVEIKNEITELLTSSSLRKLRKDKKTDNEYYLGKQGRIGEFYFERAPSPNVKLDDVVGASFDKAKEHLNQIIKTSQYPHLMRLSAPGGKIRSNILMIGPYGCGKTELARAVCGNEKVIGASVSVAGTLTAWMHESVNNVKRIYDSAKNLYIEGREMKPVALVLDEFDGWFTKNGFGFGDMDMQQIENVMLEVLDGMNDYNGIITIGMTNRPQGIPKGILRRFRYVDVVGELTNEERKKLLKMYLEKSLPVHPDIEQHYDSWAEKLKDAPGDVVRKVVDEIHFAQVPRYIEQNPKIANKIQKLLYRRETSKGINDDKDVAYLKEHLGKHFTVTPLMVDDAVDNLLKQPPIQMQIKAARKLYENTNALLDNLGSNTGSGFGLKSRDQVFEDDD